MGLGLCHLIHDLCFCLHERIQKGCECFVQDKISELHGNTNMEKCSKCGHRFIRSFRTRTAAKVHDHLTGRKCERCGGALKDTIVNFGESLPSEQLSKAHEVSQGQTQRYLFPVHKFFVASEF